MDPAGKYLRLKCPFCQAEFPLWFRPENEDDTLTPAEWERWLDTPCRECGKKPRDHESQKSRRGAKK